MAYYSKTLNDALRTGDKAKLLELSQLKKIDVKTMNQNGDTMLHLILKNFKSRPDKVVEILEIFINLDVNPNIKNRRGYTVLNLAIAKREKSVIEFLLKHNADIDVIDSEGNTIAHTFVKNELEQFIKVTKFSINDSAHDNRRQTVEKESVNFVEYLLIKRFDFDVVNQKAQSALQLALEYNLQHILPPLLKHTKNIDFVSEYGIRTLVYLFFTGCGEQHCLSKTDDLLKLVSGLELKQKFEFNSPHRIPSNYFSKQYDIDNVKVFLERDDCIEKYGVIGMRMAQLTEKHLDIIDMLYERCAKVSNKHGGKLVRRVVEKAISDYSNDQSYMKILQILITKGVEVSIEDENGLSALSYAVKRMNMPVVELMKKNGIDLTVTSKNGRNALFWLLDQLPHSYYVNGDKQRILWDLLINEGCNVSKVDNTGMMPLHLVSKTGEIGIVEKLLCHEVDVNCHENLEGKTPLHLAASEGHLEVARLLLDKEANINSVDSFGDRPIHLAVKKEQSHMVKFLLDRGADINAKGNGGDRPLHCAAMLPNHFESILHILSRRGALVNARNDQGESALVKLIRLEDTDKAIRFDDIEKTIKHLITYGADIKSDLDFRARPRNWLVCHTSSFLRYWIKMQTLTTIDSKISEWGFYALFCSKNNKLYQNSIEEIKRLKNINIDDRTTLYDWLHFRANWQYIYTRNEKLQTLINSSKLKKQFPLYSRVICGYYRRAILRKKMIEPAKEAWMKLTNIYYLSDICIENIIAHLNDGDLINLIEWYGCNVTMIL